MLGVVGQQCCVRLLGGWNRSNFSANNSQHFFCSLIARRSATMLDPFAQLFQHCWGHARSLGMVYKDLWLYPSHDALQVPTLLGVVASVCTPLPTCTQPKGFLFTSYFNDVVVFFRIFTFYLFLKWFSRRGSDARKYRAAVGYTRVWIDENSRASIPEKSHHCQRLKKWFTWHVISIVAENKPHAHHKTNLYTMKIYNTRPSQFC